MTASKPAFRPLDFHRLGPEEMTAHGRAFLERMWGRRSVRDFAPDPVPRECVELAIRAAMSAPSGAHRQPWRFVVVDDPDLKRRVREAAEEEERENYQHRFPEEWKEALAPFGTDWHKPFLETVPYLVVVFRESHGVAPDGRRITNYYVSESVGIACGLFIAALHTMGLATLTHTPNPMGFLSELLGRPSNEKPYVLFPIGYPASNALVPAIERKRFEEVVQWNVPSR